MPATVTIDQLQKNARKHVTRAREVPVEVTDASGAIAVILGVEDYEALYSAGMRRLLMSQMKEPTVSHEEVVAGAREIIRRAKRKA
jgi:PHD/YefM family antitoxin component YafN of YafNO toxin-antitoxin module